MLEVFYYLKTNKLNNYKRYGIKLSEEYDISLSINNTKKLFFIGLLNPKDDFLKFKNNEYICVRLLLDNLNFKIAEGNLKNTIYYQESIMNFNDYALGTYCKPEVLIPISILPENIEEINYNIDYPILYDNSEELYVNNLIENLSLEISNSKKIILSALLDNYSKTNKLKTDFQNNINIYYSDNFDKFYTI